MTDRPVVGVVGSDTDAVVAAVQATDARPLTDAARTVVDDSDYIVAVGESALFATARASPAAPVLPIAAGRGVRSVPADAAASAVDALLAEEYRVTSHPVVEARVGDRARARALFDVMLVSAEAAQISEYAVENGTTTVAQFRADGVVVATPAGSGGYASAAGGPVLASGTDVLSVTAVAPFETDTDDWVLPTEKLEVSVERDETAVHLLADDRVVGPVEPHEPVVVTPNGSLSVAVVAASQPPYLPA